ncbi:hypothetical protein [Winogradskyella arenosi]|uniref:Uncharacterized protein n=1 Tax=Winogradskyella arenosi TaxID=533325 RepID=A0A368ZH00_9FLAO|nr:hypothetical protein [Winogradskyella arenosi]RCW92784.1 hypothetical protein DFQ08_102820 [Winogradskyella arenosi]
MELDNIEKLIQDNFESREIKPSLEAKERLIIALNTNLKKKKKMWLHYAVAASLLLGLLLTGSQFLLNTENPVEPLRSGTNLKIVEETRGEDNDVSESHIVTNAIDTVKKVDLEPVTTTVNVRRSKSMAKVLKHQPVTEELPVKTSSESQPNEHTNLQNENLVKVESNESQSKMNSQESFQYITADQLLQIATTDNTIELRKSKTKDSKNYLESDVLLVEMEKELFYEKNKSIFKKAAKQLKELKEAVADRNYEHKH